MTSLDRRIAQVYPIDLGTQTEKFLETYRGRSEAAENLAFNAADLGAQAEMDAQARILFRRNCAASWESKPSRSACLRSVGVLKC